MSGKPLLDLGEAEWSIVQTILQMHVPDREVWAFGSRAKWNAKEFSDLDLAVIGQTPLKPAVSAALADDFANSDLPWKVDVVDWATTSESFRKIIARDKVVVQSAGKGARAGLGMSFKTVLLEELAAPIKYAIVGGPFGSNLVSGDYTTSGIPVIRGQNMGDRWVGGNFVFVSEEKANSLASNKARPGDLVFTQRGTLGQVSQIPNGAYAEYVVSQSQMKITLDPTKADANFMYYTFCSPEQIEYIKNTSIQTGVPHTNLGILKKTPVHIPTLNVQRKIGRMLGALDDRITLLRETNGTLEGIAQTLFKSWFVDFDPVRAKAEGRVPEAMDEATAAMFPDSLEESELGLVPRGWAICSLDQHVSAERGLSYKGAGLTERGQGVPMHNLNSVLEGGGYKYPGIKFYNGVFKDKHVVNSGEIIVANTEQGHEHRLIGFPAIVPRAYAGTAIFSHHIYRVRLLDGSPLSMSFLYRTLMTPAVREQIIGCANGSTVNMLKVVGLQTPKFVCPSSQVCKAYELIASPIQDAIEANVEQMRSLAALRDTLLPRLISGQLRLPNPEPLCEVTA